MIQLPTNRLGNKQIQLQRNPIPLDQIIAVQGQNPLATGIETAGNAIGQAIQKRAALRQQGQQLAQIAQLAGTTAPTGDTGLTPDLYEKGLTLKDANDAKKATAAKQRVELELKMEGMKKGWSEIDPTTGNIVKYPGVQGLSIDYDQAGNPVIKRDPTTYAPAIAPPKNNPGANGTLVQSGLFDTNGQPIMVNNKTGKPMTIGTGVGTGNQVKTMLAPTSQTRSTSEFANTLLPHIQSMKQQIAEADAKGYIGPAAGRIYGDFLAGKVGSTGNPDADTLLGRLRATDSLMKTGAMKVHFGARGGGQMYDHFSDLLNTGKQSAAMLNGSLDGIQEFIQGYADAGKGGSQPLKSLPPAGSVDLGGGFTYKVKSK